LIYAAKLRVAQDPDLNNPPIKRPNRLTALNFVPGGTARPEHKGRGSLELIATAQKIRIPDVCSTGCHSKLAVRHG
jgi:hypothetical protein